MKINLYTSILLVYLQCISNVADTLSLTAMKTTTEPNDAILKQFIVEVSLIDPINKIVKNLKGGNYGDCDIKWLDAKLEGFIKFAGESLGVYALMPSQVFIEPFTILNDHNTKHYLTKFETLVNYFKTI